MSDQKFIELKFSPQSYKWGSIALKIADGIAVSSPRNVRLLKVEAGKHTEYTLCPGGDWHGEEIHYSGQIKISNISKGDAILAIVSTGSWSGGSNYSGFIFGKPGAAVWFGRKGRQQWLVFTESGVEWHDTKPGAVPVEL